MEDKNRQREWQFFLLFKKKNTLAYLQQIWLPEGWTFLKLTGLYRQIAPKIQKFMFTELGEQPDLNPKENPCFYCCPARLNLWKD